MNRNAQSYAERIDRVLAHLEREDLGDRAASLEQLSSIAAMSPHHFHRVFRLMTGETLGEAVRRIRLARSLPELAGEASVTAASGASGYGSSQSFARALRREAGSSATEIRADPGRLAEVQARLSQSPASDAPLSVTIASLTPFRLLAIRNVGDYRELNSSFAHLFELVTAEVDPASLQGIYGVPHHDPRVVAPHECVFDCALAVGGEGRATGELLEMTLGGGDHLVVRCRGDYDLLHEKIDLAYAAALGEAGREIGEAPLFLHYLDDPEEVAPEECRADICLPLA